MKRLIAALAFVIGLSTGAQAQIALLTGPSDPSQLIATINQVIRAINASAFSQAFPTPSGGMSTVPNGIVLTAAASGSIPTIAPTTVANGGDANASLAINPNGNGNIVLFSQGGGTGTGTLVFANSASFVPIKTLAPCPGYVRGFGPPGLSPVITGYMTMIDYLGRLHYDAVC